MKPRVAISLGDPCGIAPEVIVRALGEPRVRETLTPLVFGDEAIWRRAIDLTGVDPDLPFVRPHQIPEDRSVGAVVTVTDLGHAAAPYGGETEASARAQLGYLDAAVEAAIRGDADALCTGPVTKSAVAKVEPTFRGHTEFLRDRYAVPRVAMMLAGPKLRVVLVTTHVAVRDVADRITEEAVVETTRLAHRALREWFDIPEPQIAVCGLNPHAGEGGHFGREDLEVIAPALERLREEGLLVRGPVAADSAMPRAVEGRYDVVVAMFHDQGLAPIKTLHFDEAVNVTLGLPIPRTSPDHGSALDIAGTGRARPGAMIASLLLAARLAA
ncbi:MAG: 4-hydroxythreonine-4-phosphate dehydrogenase PdxA [Deltaproteobacteria bacterium]|nr:MAG: 4-hydroxythreonine-4-phosphate dehydrogenase PdxA [Deltaproteobacteria bacterium]